MSADWKSLKFKAVGRPFWLQNDSQLRYALEKLERLGARTGSFMAELNVPGKGRMRIGLGQHLSVLSYKPETPSKKDMPSVSRGLHASEKIVFFPFCEYPQGYHRSRLISIDVAREGLIHFFNTGELSPDMEWTEWEPL